MANYAENLDLIWEVIDDDEELEFIVNYIFGDELQEDADNAARAYTNRALRRSWDWWEAMEDPQFNENFRMPRATFQMLLAAYRTHLEENNRLIRLRTPVGITSMMGLWILATGDTFHSAGVNFGVSRGVVFFHYLVVIEALREMAPTYIRWPDAAERVGIKARYEERYGYPGVAVCDDNPLVRDVYIGEPGSVGDARTFSRIPLLRNLTTRLDLLAEDEHLLGDGAYPLSSFVLKPYQDDGHVLRHQRYHNYVLSRARSSVERMFGLLKGKIRRLKMMYSFNIHYAVDHIMASFVLHNFIILNGEEAPGLQVNDDPPQVQRQYNEQQAYEHGLVKREYIAHMLQPEEVADADDPA